MAGSRQDPQTGNQDIWLHDLARASPSRFTYHASRDLAPVWSRDAGRIAFASTREGASNLYLKDSNSLGNEELLLKSADDKLATDWSRDGRFLLYSTRDRKTQSDLWVLPVTGDRKPIPFLRTEFNESQGQFSPDGHWVAYTSDESGKSEVYVQPFSAGTQSPGGKSIISFGGGNQPRWRADGKEIFYLSPDRKMIVVEIRTSPKLETGLPRSLFEAPIGPSTNMHRYAVTPDGKRFLITTLGEETGSAPITVVLNWTAGLKR